jgi:hypothetical protein
VKIISVHVSACTDYDCNNLGSVVSAVTEIGGVFVYVIGKMRNWNVEDRISIQVCVKLSLEMQRGAFSMTRKQITKPAVENTSISKTQKILHDGITHKNNAYCFV